MLKPDYIVSNHGSIYLVTPQSDAARDHLTDNLADGAQWFGPALAVEHRYIRPLADQLLDHGWNVNWDQTA